MGVGGNPSSACICVYRETGLSSVRHSTSATSLLPVVRSEKRWPLYITRHACPFFEPPRYLRSSSFVSPNCPASAKKDLSAHTSEFSIATFVRSFVRSSRWP